MPHLACELLNSAAGINITHVPYRGALEAMQDLIAGRIDYQCVTLSPAIAEIESKMGLSSRAARSNAALLHGIQAISLARFSRGEKWNSLLIIGEAP